MGKSNHVVEWWIVQGYQLVSIIYKAVCNSYGVSLAWKTFIYCLNYLSMVMRGKFDAFCVAGLNKHNRYSFANFCFLITTLAIQDIVGPDSNVHFFSDESVKFFCFQVLEHHIKTRYTLCNLFLNH